MIILAYVRFQESVRRAGRVLTKPGERKQWITLREGEVRKGLGIVFGVNPSSLAHPEPVMVEALAVVLDPALDAGTFPREVLGLYRIEAE